MNVSWDAAPVLGIAPPFHLDPAPGGPPLVSPDGRWRWAGDHWVLLDLSDATSAA